MQLTGNTILITGGGSGIGRALAKSFHDLGNQVIITGRRADALDQTTAASPGMKSRTLDVTSADAIRDFSTELVRDFPKLNVVIHNAGIARMESFKDAARTDADAEAMIATNILGPIRLNTALLPHLLEQPSGAILTVSSGLAFLPLALGPTYSATKAFLHSWTESLRYQLTGTNLQVIEIIPPYVQTELGGEHQANDPNAMPLADYIAETMSLLQSEPSAKENLVERVKPLRFAAENGGYDAFFTNFNDAMSAARH